MMVTGHTTGSTSNDTPFSVSVGASPAVRLLPANPRRLGFILTNSGVKDCYLGGPDVAEGSGPQAHGGIRLASGGTLDQGQMMGYTGPLWAITAGSDTTTVAVLEW